MSCANLKEGKKCPSNTVFFGRENTRTPPLKCKFSILIKITQEGLDGKKTGKYSYIKIVFYQNVNVGRSDESQFIRVIYGRIWQTDQV